MAKYWFRIGKEGDIGPYPTREEALADAIARGKPVTGKRNKDILTGYGEFGAHFDMRWDRNPHWKPQS